jgi:tetratricopeptide (TPR) repeat protein
MMEPDPLQQQQRVDARADVWSWGVIVYAVLSRSLNWLSADTEAQSAAKRHFFLGLSSDKTWRAELEGLWGGAGSLPPELLDLVASATADRRRRASLWRARQVLGELRGLPDLARGPANLLIMAEEDLIDGSSEGDDDIASSLLIKANAHRNLEEYAQEADSLYEYVELHKRLYRLAGNLPSCDDKSKLMGAIHRLADRLQACGHYLENALELYEEAENVALGEPHLLFRAYQRTAFCLKAMMRPEDARQRGEAAISELRKFKAQNSDTLANIEIAQLSKELGDVLLLIGKSDEGVICLELAAERVAEQHWPDPCHSKVLAAQMRLADGYCEAGRTPAALEVYGNILANLASDGGGAGDKCKLWRARVLEAMASVHDGNKEAITMLEEALQLRREVQGPRHVHVAEVEVQLVSMQLPANLKRINASSITTGGAKEKLREYKRQLRLALQIQEEGRLYGHRSLFDALCAYTTACIALASEEDKEEDKEEALDNLLEMRRMLARRWPGGGGGGGANLLFIKITCIIAVLAEHLEERGKALPLGHSAASIADELLQHLTSASAEALRESAVYLPFLLRLGDSSLARGEYARTVVLWRLALQGWRVQGDLAELRATIVHMASAFESEAEKLRLNDSSGQQEVGVANHVPWPSPTAYTNFVLHRRPLGILEPPDPSNNLQ